MTNSEDNRKKRIEQRQRDAIRDGLRAKSISREKYTHESANFINFGLRTKKQREAKKIESD